MRETFTKVNLLYLNIFGQNRIDHLLLVVKELNQHIITSVVGYCVGPISQCCFISGLSKPLLKLYLHMLTLHLASLIGYLGNLIMLSFTVLPEIVSGLQLMFDRVVLIIPFHVVYPKRL